MRRVHQPPGGGHEEERGGAAVPPPPQPPPRPFPGQQEHEAGRPAVRQDRRGDQRMQGRDRRLLADVLRLLLLPPRAQPHDYPQQEGRPRFLRRQAVRAPSQGRRLPPARGYPTLPRRPRGGEVHRRIDVRHLKRVIHSHITILYFPLNIHTIQFLNKLINIS